MEGIQMSLFPKFKIPSQTPAIPAIPAIFRAESSNSSESSNPRATVEAEDDPILSVDEWLPEYLAFRKKVYQQVKDANIWGYARTEKPELYAKLRAAEAKLDGPSDARLSEVMELLGQWRAVMLQIQFEEVRAERNVQ